MTARTWSTDPARRTGQPVRRNSQEAGGEYGSIWTRFTTPMDRWWAEARRRLSADARAGGWRIRHLHAQLIGDLFARVVDKRTGRLEPSYELIMRTLGLCKQAVADALELLEDLDLLGRRRRFVHISGEGRKASYRQTANAYWFQLPRAAQALLAHKHRDAPPCEAELARRREQAARATAAAAEALRVGCPNARAAALAERRAAAAPRPATPEEEAASIARIRAASVRKSESKS